MIKEKQVLLIHVLFSLTKVTVEMCRSVETWLHYVLVDADHCLAEFELSFAQVVLVDHVIVAETLENRFISGGRVMPWNNSPACRSRCWSIPTRRPAEHCSQTCRLNGARCPRDSAVSDSVRCRIPHQTGGSRRFQRGLARNLLQ